MKVINASVLLVIAALSLAGCKKDSPACYTEERIAAVSSTVIVDTLDCVNADAVNADVLAWYQSKLHMCEAPQPTGPIAMFACPLIASFVKAKLKDAIQNRPLMKRWGCTGGAAVDIAIGTLTIGCEALPF